MAFARRQVPNCLVVLGPSAAVDHIVAPGTGTKLRIHLQDTNLEAWNPVKHGPTWANNSRTILDAQMVNQQKWGFNFDSTFKMLS